MVKIASIGFLALILLIPLGMIKNLVDERSAYRGQAMEAVAQSWSESQTLIGPILVVPYNKAYTVQEWNEKKRVETTKTIFQKHHLFLPPEELNITAHINTEERYKGIYTFPVYRAETRLSGCFKINDVKHLLEQDGVAFQTPPYLVIGISDPRGIRTVPSMEWNGQTLRCEPGCPNNTLDTGIHATLPTFTTDTEGTLIRFQLDLKLQGMGHFKVAPVGRSALVHYQSDWPHPSFVGPYPTARSQINEKGFTSTWEISHFATNIRETFNTTKAENFDDLVHTAIGVQLINPVDVYQITERALKYGFLFVALTFVVFFLFEILKQLRIHPVQYGLVGIALALFFMLLLSLSEHIAFHWAYLIATGACVGLLTYYVAYVLGSLSRATGFGLLLCIIYGTIYTLLQLEDLALLTGSLLVFVVLGIIMTVTRKFDWYHLIPGSSAEAEELQDASISATVENTEY